MRFRPQPVFRLFPAVACFVSFFSCSRAAAQAPQTPLVLTSSQQKQLAELTKRVLDHADRAGCKKNSCTILVVNFAGPSGSTSIFGMQLADAFSAQLAASSSATKVADRQRLQAFLEKERIPSKLLEEDNAARWLAHEQSANAALVGFLQDSPGGVHLRVQLLDSHEVNYRKPMKEGPIEDVTFDHLDADLAPAEPFPRTLASPSSSSAPLIRTVGEHGVRAPSCQYCPNPSYTDPARVAKFSGNLILQVTVSPEGRTIETSIFQGLPYGLNEAARKAVEHWQFTPAMHEGQAVACMVLTEVTFRLR